MKSNLGAFHFPGVIDAGIFLYLFYYRTLDGLSISRKLMYDYKV